jgi:hypothetical protein
LKRVEFRRSSSSSLQEHFGHFEHIDNFVHFEHIEHFGHFKHLENWGYFEHIDHFVHFQHFQHLGAFGVILGISACCHFSGSPISIHYK